MDANETQRLIHAELKVAALQAGIVDLDALKLLDTSSVKLNAAGDIEGAKELFDKARQAKPHLFGKDKTAKHTSNMTDAEYIAARSRLTGHRRASGRH
jgi:hypothetical protein